MDQNTIREVVSWMKEYLKNAKADGIVLGMSGGKDSLVVAKLATLACGNSKVLGIIMPNGKMKDKSIAIDSCKLLRIPYMIIDIKKQYDGILKNTNKVINEQGRELTTQTTINIAPRVRTTTLYAIAQSMNYMVANTSNLSESMVGYTTKWGDNVGDIGPISEFTKTEVCQMGLLLGLPAKYINKLPDDGLSGVTDEEKFGFTYAELDKFIRKGEKGPNFTKIEKLHKYSEHKRSGVAVFKVNSNNYFN